VYKVEHLLPSYRDPLFSILLIVLLVFVISVATYGWNLYKQQKEQGRLLKFLDRFDSSECALDTANMPFEEHLLKPLTLLAKAFENAGEYHKAINLYLYLIKHADNETLRIELTERLGTTYLHAGFLERARSIYVEILRKRPRNVKVLYELGIVYEAMRDYERAKEVLEPLEMLGEEVERLRHHLEFLQIIHDTKLETETKIARLESLLSAYPALYREVLAAMFRLDTATAWRHVDTERLEEILDILWFLPVSQLDLDIIANDKKLATLYYAKGYRKQPESDSGIFSIDVIAKAGACGLKDAGLEFSYLCTSCKHTFPVSFTRCPNCMALYSLKVEENVAKISAQESHSLF
jgi:tetratricopeptide (TPR) repeat protein